MGAKQALSLMMTTWNVVAAALFVTFAIVDGWSMTALRVMRASSFRRAVLQLRALTIAQDHVRASAGRLDHAGVAAEPRIGGGQIKPRDCRAR